MDQRFVFTCILELIFLCGVKYIFYGGELIFKLLPAMVLLLWTHFMSLSAVGLISNFCLILGDYYLAKVDFMESDTFMIGIAWFGLANLVLLIKNISYMSFNLHIPPIIAFFWFIYGCFASFILTSNINIRYRFVICVYATVLIWRLTVGYLTYHLYNIHKYEAIASGLFILSDILVFSEFEFGLRNDKWISVLSLGTYWLSLIFHNLNLIFGI